MQSKKIYNLALRNQIVTSNLCIVGYTDSTDSIVGHRCHFSCTSGSMPRKEREKETRNPYSHKCCEPRDNHLPLVQ